MNRDQWRRQQVEQGKQLQKERSEIFTHQKQSLYSKVFQERHVATLVYFCAECKCYTLKDYLTRESAHSEFYYLSVMGDVYLTAKTQCPHAEQFFRDIGLLIKE